MKRAVCVLLTFVFLFSLLLPTMSINARDVNEEKSIESFVDGIVELSQEFDSEKEFVIDEPIKENNVEQFYSNGEVTETPSDTEYDLVDFQTARLIVRADKNFNTYGAIKCISGFLNFYILQYATPKDAQIAYNQLSGNLKILDISPDQVINPLKSEDSSFVSGPTNNESLNEWCKDRTQSDRLLDYIEEKDLVLDDIVVGVVDTGVDYNHEFLQKRIIRTYFNSSIDGTQNDESDALNPEYSHGTATSSIIIDNTPENVKIAMYRVINEVDGLATVTQICSGYLRAIEDGVDVINVSLGYNDNSGLTDECVEKAFDENIPFIVASGNDAAYYNNYPAVINKCITVSSTNENNFISDFATINKSVDISAPGEDVRVAIPNNLYAIWSGTSFSAPCVTALCAILKASNLQLTVKMLEKTLMDTALPVNERAVTHTEENKYWLDGFNNGLSGKGLVQFCDAFGLSKIDAPTCNLETQYYIDSQTCTLTCPDPSAKILYTTNGTYPDNSNGTEYSMPFEITELTQIRAVTYYSDNDYYSQTIEIVPNIFYVDDDEMFTINNDGIITDYKGAFSNISIPEKINNIYVSGIESTTFDGLQLTGIILPDGIKTIPSKAFYDNETLYCIQGNGVEIVESSAFYNATSLFHAVFPNLKTVGNSSFYGSSLIKADYPLLENVDYASFANTLIYSFDGPNVKSVSRLSFGRCGNLSTVSLPICTDTNYAVAATATSGTFYNCSSLCNVYMPKVKALNKGCLRNCPLDMVELPALVKIYSNVFTDSKVSRAEFSCLETAKSFPVVENSIISLPSSFKECTEETKGRNYIIYGTEGTYAETWAEENNHTFVILNSTNAILEDLPAEYYGLGEVLSPDVIGFNKNYQWYSNTTPDNINGTAIDGATDKEFNPADFPQAKYYYCVVTSQDGNNEPIEIRTGVIENKAYKAKTILSNDSSQIRFTKNEDGSFANKFDVRARAVITDADFKEYIADTNAEAEKKISQVGFVFTTDKIDFQTDLAQRVAQGENISGYANAPVRYIQDADGYYMFTCLVTNIPVEDMQRSLISYAYICVDEEWYFFENAITTSFSELYDVYYPQAAEKYGWTTQTEVLL